MMGVLIMKFVTLVEDTTKCELGAEHGLSIYAETEKHKLLFDVGTTDLFIKNAKALGIDLSQVDTVVISTQHSPEVSLAQIREDMIEQVVKKVIPSHLLDENTKYFINPTGRFVIGGPHGDSGLTGRKIIVDTYGGIGRHGGGAFSGKDPTKVDRSGAYAARWVAKNIVAAGLAKRCEIQLAYAIGVAEPVSIMVETFGTGVVGDDVLEKAVEKVFDLRPAAIIEQLDLRKPIYKQLAAYGHMGREELGVKWENTDKVEALKAAVQA